MMLTLYKNEDTYNSTEYFAGKIFLEYFKYTSDFVRSIPYFKKYYDNLTKEKTNVLSFRGHSMPCH